MVTAFTKSIIISTALLIQFGLLWKCQHFTQTTQFRIKKFNMIKWCLDAQDVCCYLFCCIHNIVRSIFRYSDRRIATWRNIFRKWSFPTALRTKNRRRDKIYRRDTVIIHQKVYFLCTNSIWCLFFRLLFLRWKMESYAIATCSVLWLKENYSDGFMLLDSRKKMSLPYVTAELRSGQRWRMLEDGNFPINFFNDSLFLPISSCISFPVECPPLPVPYKYYVIP